MIDLDALLGESAPRPLGYKGQTFDLPGELPAEAVAPFLGDDLGLLDLIADVVTSDDDADDDDLIELVFAALKSRPTLPKGLLEAASAALRALLDDQYDEFVALKPSVPAYLLLAKNIASEYAVSLSDFFGLGESSETDTETSSPTSNSTTDSTPEASGDDQETPDS
jgi:hypothetical protein